MSPSQRSIAWLKANGYDLVRKVENWNHFAHIRQDLFGCDIIAVSVNPPQTLLVQVTSGTNVSARVKKLQALESTSILKLAGWSISAHGWRKLKKTGKWSPRIINL